jgi:hypothetical protein
MFTKYKCGVEQHLVITMRAVPRKPRAAYDVRLSIQIILHN